MAELHTRRRRIGRPALAALGLIALAPAGAAPADHASASSPPPAYAAAPSASGQAQLEAGWDDFRAAIADVTAFVRRSAFYATPEDRAAAYSFITGMMIARMEEDVVFDPLFPYFRILDHRIREGGDNPDQRYLITNLKGGESYRIWGRTGSQRRLEFQVYAGDPYVPGGGRSASYLGQDQLRIDEDGRFEVFLTPQRHAGNWIENPADATQLLVREIYSDWAKERPGDIHIDRIGHEGDAKPALTEEAMAARLHKAAADLRTHVKVWPQMVAAKYMQTPNVLGPPVDPGSIGGVPGRFMVSGSFDLAPDEALIVRAWPASGNYQGIQLADLWFSSLEYANRQTSLTGDQTVRDRDGSYRFVISAQDPGVPNWLDTMGRRRGLILMRFDGMRERRFDPRRAPVATKIKLAEVGKLLPAGTARISAADRATELAARRRHIQVRYGD